MTKKEYVVVEGGGLDVIEDFEAEVSAFREEGWEPVGGVAVNVIPMPEEDEDTYLYYQAMVRDIEIKDKNKKDGE